MEKHDGGRGNPPGLSLPSLRSMNMQKENSGHNRIINDSDETPRFDPGSLGLSKQNSNGLGIDVLNSSTSVSARNNRSILEPRHEAGDAFITAQLPLLSGANEDPADLFSSR